MKRAIHTRDQLWRLFQAITEALDRGPLMVEFAPYKPPKSLSQNALIHVIIDELADELGYTKSQMKWVCKQEYWPTERIETKKRVYIAPKSTADLSREEASLVIEKLYWLASELGVRLKEVS